MHPRATRGLVIALAIAAVAAIGVALAGGTARDRSDTDDRARDAAPAKAAAGSDAAPREGERRGREHSRNRPRDRGRERNRRHTRIEWRRSRSAGTYTRGRLVRGVQVPAAGKTFFTWDPIRRESPNRAWRLWGNDRLVRMIVRVLDDFAEAHPRAPRIAIGDLSRPRGGDFGPRYGLPGHVSHQNGLDADLYYPRRDRRERAPRSAGQIDRRLSQDLVDRFVRAGAAKVFVGPSTGLRGRADVVQAIPNHDTHLHVRIAP